jgi:hypothetical protein
MGFQLHPLGLFLILNVLNESSLTSWVLSPNHTMICKLNEMNKSDYGLTCRQLFPYRFQYWLRKITETLISNAHFLTEILPKAVFEWLTFCFIFGRSRVQISALRPAGFPQSLQENACIVPETRPQPLPSTSFPILHSYIALSLTLHSLSYWDCVFKLITNKTKRIK